MPPGSMPAASVPAASVPAGTVPAGAAQGVPAHQDATGQVPLGQVGPGQGAPVQGGVAAAPVAPGTAVPPQGVPVPAQGNAVPPQGNAVNPQGSAMNSQAHAVPPQGVSVPAQGGLGQSVQAALPGQVLQPSVPAQPLPQQGIAAPGQPAAGGPLPAEAVPGQAVPGHGAPPQAAPAQTTPPQGTPAQATPPQSTPPQATPPQSTPPQGAPAPGVPGAGAHGTPPQGGNPAAQPWPAADDTSGAGIAHPAPANGTPPRAAQQHTPAPGTPLPPEGTPRAAQPLPAEAAAPPVDPNSSQGRAISVRTLGQGVPFTRQAAQVQQPSAVSAPQSAALQSATPPPHQPGGSGRRRKLGTPPDPAARTDQTARPEQGQPRPAGQGPRPEQAARPHPASEHTPPPVAAQVPAPATAPVPAQPSLAGQSRLAQMTEGGGRSYAIGAPDENAAEGPEPLDGPGGAVEVADPPRPQPMDDELPPEPLDNPRRLLVWPAPDVSTQQALSDRGYRPVIVNSREEVDAQIAAFPAALFVDPLTGPITRTALQSLRQAAVAAEVPVLVTAGLGQASRDAAYGADPAVLLKALAPRDTEQHPPRVLLIEEHAEIALALTATLERRGMQVARAASDADAVTLAGQFRPNLVVMDLLQVQRRQEGFAGIVDWLRANGQLNRTPLVVYTAAVDQADLPRLASGETVLFLAERSTSNEVQSRIVDLLSRIGTN